VPGGVPGCFDGPETVAPGLDLVALVDVNERWIASRAEPDARMLPLGPLDLLGWKAEFRTLVFHVLEEPLRTGPSFQDRRLARADQRPRPRPVQRRHEADVIGMHVRDEEIRPLQIDPELVKPGSQCAFALRHVHPRVDHQGPAPAGNHPAVDRPERRMRQWNLDTKQPRKNLVKSHARKGRLPSPAAQPPPMQFHPLTHPCHPASCVAVPPSLRPLPACLELPPARKVSRFTPNIRAIRHDPGPRNRRQRCGAGADGRQRNRSGHAAASPA